MKITYGHIIWVISRNIPVASTFRYVSIVFRFELVSTDFGTLRGLVKDYTALNDICCIQKQQQNSNFLFQGINRSVNINGNSSKSSCFTLKLRKVALVFTFHRHMFSFVFMLYQIVHGLTWLGSSKIELWIKSSKL